MERTALVKCGFTSDESWHRNTDGAIPPEDYAFIVVTVVVLGLLFVPSVRRFFNRSEES